MLKKIGVICWTEILETREKIATNDYFLQAVARAGALPFSHPSTSNEETLDAFLDFVDGVILTGGEDISPHLYGEDTKRKTGKVNMKRDLGEIAILKKIFEKKIPCLAVCRGMQLANVYLGGTLYQDIYEETKTDIAHSHEGEFQENFHFIKIKKKSKLYEALGSKVLVNSLHHQAIKDLAKDLSLVASSSDGIIEAVETKDDHLFMGVQFHPEFRDLEGNYDKLFKYFIEKVTI